MEIGSQDPTTNERRPRPVDPVGAEVLRLEKCPTQRRPRPVDPVGAEALRLEKCPRARSGRGTNLYSKPIPQRPQRFTLASPGGPYPRANSIGLLADLSEAKSALRPSKPESLDVARNRNPDASVPSKSGGIRLPNARRSKIGPSITTRDKTAAGSRQQKSAAGRPQPSSSRLGQGFTTKATRPSQEKRSRNRLV